MKKTSLGLIPRDWKVVRLDTVAKRGSGHTPDKEHPEYWGGAIKWISLADSDRLDHVYISETAQTITLAGIAHSSAVVHTSGTVVLSRDAGIGKSAIMTEDMAVSQHFMAWRCGPDLENLFLYYWLQSRKSEFERIAAGNTIKTIGLPYFRLLEIPLPPMNEQRAISTALLDVDEWLKAQDTLNAKKRAIKLATMQQLLTGKTRLPGFSGSWVSKRLRDESQLITKGTTPSSLGLRFVEDGISFIKVESLTDDGVILPDRLAHIDEVTHTLLQRSQLKDKDVLFSIAGALGRTAVVSAEYLPANINQALALIRLNERSSLNPEFLARYLSTSQHLRRVAAISVRAAQANLSLEDVGHFEIPTPTQEEQSAIIQVLSNMEAEIVALERRRDKTKAVKQGMMQQLLTGRTRLV